MTARFDAKVCKVADLRRSLAGPPKRMRRATRTLPGLLQSRRASEGACKTPNPLDCCRRRVKRGVLRIAAFARRDAPCAEQFVFLRGSFVEHHAAQRK